eukprot:TRINITY_DN34830_c3_g1_i1.p1 TRINITY_DN34830_c3_g1~~TRINITY_DN34830_c3_g1_i1.p1  ORF type:complete len:802 (-),score=129.15 TRINITY_DN34830_c3_g1_i1:49-2454(-)
MSRESKETEHGTRGRPPSHRHVTSKPAVTPLPAAPTAPRTHHASPHDVGSTGHVRKKPSHRTAEHIQGSATLLAPSEEPAASFRRHRQSTAPPAERCPSRHSLSPLPHAKTFSSSSRRSLSPLPHRKTFPSPSDDGGDETAGTTRRLSFVDCTLTQIEASIKSEDPEWNFNRDFWTVILTKEPLVTFRPFANRTLSYWVSVFNKWVELCKTNRSCVEAANCCQLQTMMSISRHNILEVILLINPEGGKRLQTEGLAQDVMERVKSSPIELMMAGVLLSRLISTKHKLRFVFGIMDFEDSGTLDEHEFAIFVGSFVRGLGGVFGVSHGLMPTKHDTNGIARRLYQRIGAIAASRVRDMLKDSAHDLRQTVADAIKARQSKRSLRSGGGVAEAEAKRKGQTLPFKTLLDWCYGSLSDVDPLALPYRLTIARFCPSRHEDLVDEFDDQLEDFKLSHHDPVRMPSDSDQHVSAQEMPSRFEVLLAKRLFDHCKKTSKFSIEVEDVESVLGKEWKRSPIPRHTTLKISKAMSALVDEKLRSTNIKTAFARIDFFDLLRRLCPRAQPKHLRMFDTWCHTFDDLAERDEEVHNLEKVIAVYADNETKPFMPVSEIHSLEDEFRKLDNHGRGYITANDLVNGWGWYQDEAEDTVASVAHAGDGLVDMHDFVRMMCPSEYKLPEMHGYSRELFGRFLASEVHHRKRELDDSRNRYASQNAHRLHSAMPTSLLPEVDPEVMKQWNRVFDELDVDKDDVVHETDLERAGILSHETSEAIAALIDPQDKTGFTRAGFIDAMLSAHGLRKGFHA